MIIDFKKEHGGNFAVIVDNQPRPDLAIQLVNLKIGMCFRACYFAVVGEKRHKCFGYNALEQAKLTIQESLTA